MSINHIDIFCEDLKEYWKKVPNWRFGQLISNVLSSGYIRDPFYMEDHEVMDLFKDFFDEKEKNHELPPTDNRA